MKAWMGRARWEVVAPAGMPSSVALDGAVAVDRKAVRPASLYRQQMTLLEQVRS